MIHFRRGSERGHFNYGWLDTFHTFSFSDYYDPKHVEFRDLRVINEDRVQSGQGFPPHSHRDMEIITYILEGSLKHEDSLGTGSVIKPGEVQRMSAGSGITHSEFNASDKEPVHLLQIWIKPAEKGIKPSYEQKSFSRQSKLNRWCHAVSPDGGESVAIHQDAHLFISILEAGKNLEYRFKKGRYGWLHVARGAASVAGEELTAGDAVALSAEPLLEVKALKNSEILLFDLK